MPYICSNSIPKFHVCIVGTSFNPFDVPIPLAGYTVVADDRCDDDGDPEQYLLLRGEIQARGYLLIWADDDR